MYLCIVMETNSTPDLQQIIHKLNEISMQIGILRLEINDLKNKPNVPSFTYPPDYLSVQSPFHYRRQWPYF